MCMMLRINFMPLPLLLLLFHLLSFTLAASLKPLSDRGITFPKESFDDCFVDEANTVPGRCKNIKDCPTVLDRLLFFRLEPKSCYFIGFEQFVCCANVQEEKAAIFDTRIIPGPRRPSVNACYDAYGGPPIDASAMGLSLPFAAVGGLPTGYREFPAMAALGWQSNFDQGIHYRCGGVLISPKFVLTAAHCMDLGGALPVTVRLGGDNLTQTEYTEDYGIERIIIHPDYNANSNANDIALLELQVRNRFKTQIDPACIWPQTKLAFDTHLIALGYGQTQFAGLSSQQLLKVFLDAVANTDCQPHYSADILPQGLQPSHLCAGDPQSKMDTCQGDSGGPLLMKYGRYLFVVGITSLGLGCASGPPSIYTRVSHYADWIEQIVWPN